MRLLRDSFVSDRCTYRMSSFVTSDNRPPTDERMDRRREEPNRGMRFPRGGRGRGGSPYWGGAKTKEADDRQVLFLINYPTI